MSQDCTRTPVPGGGGGRFFQPHVPAEPLPLAADAIRRVAGAKMAGQPLQVAYVGLSVPALRSLGRQAALRWRSAAARSLSQLARAHDERAVVAVPYPGSFEFLAFLPGSPEAAAWWLAAVLDPAGDVRRVGPSLVLRGSELRVSVLPFSPDASVPPETEVAVLYRELQCQDPPDLSRLDDPLDGLLRDRRIVLATQPIFDLASMQVYGIEALVRGHVASSVVLPSEMFPRAVRTGRFPDLERLCREATLRPEVLPGGKRKLFVNIDLRLSVESVRRLVVERGLPARRLVIEVSEASVYDEPDAIVRDLASCKDMGMEIALDDVGAGFTGLPVLALFPWDYLKIDRRLVVEATRSRAHRHLIEALQSFAIRSGSRVVAEGIESGEELRLCTQLRIALGQGYLLARPRLWDGASGGSAHGRSGSEA